MLAFHVSLNYPGALWFLVVWLGIRVLFGSLFEKYNIFGRYPCVWHPLKNAFLLTFGTFELMPGTLKLTIGFTLCYCCLLVRYVWILLVTSDQSPIMDNVSDKNRFDASWLKRAKILLINVKRYIRTFPINGFANKCKWVWTKLMLKSSETWTNH